MTQRAKGGLPRRRLERRQPLIRPRLKTIRIGVIIVFSVLGITGGLLVLQVYSVRNDLSLAMGEVSNLHTQLSDGPDDETQRSFKDLREHISAARSTTTGPLWNAASGIPLIGANFHAVREASVSADDVVNRAIGPLMGIYATLEWHSLTPIDGRIDTSTLADAEPAITTAASTIEISHQRLVSIDTSALLPDVATPIKSVTEQLGSLKTPLRAASSVAQLLPAMVGSAEERSYLLLIQNNSETRATGGIPGALAVITANDGRLELGEQGSATAMGLFNPPIEVDTEQEALYTARLGNRMQNVNMTPDFPTAASTARTMWELRNGGKIDGVVALDPVVLSRLLSATGPVDLINSDASELIAGTNLPTKLTAENVSATLLSGVYHEIEDPDLQDLYFAEVAAAVFDAFTQGSTDGRTLVDALVTSVQDERLYLWSSHGHEQQIIGETDLSGSIGGSGAAGASFGVFFNDGTGGKMDYYAEREIALRKTCIEPGVSRYSVGLTLRNLVSPDEAPSLPRYVTGGGTFGVSPGHIRTNYYVYGPAQSLLETATVNGQSVPFGSGVHDQRPVGTLTVELQPSESVDVELTFIRVVQDSEPYVRVTPGVSDAQTVIRPLETTGCE